MANCTVCAGPLRYAQMQPTDAKDTGARMFHASPEDKLRCRMILAKPHAATRYDPVRQVFVKRSR